MTSERFRYVLRPSYLPIADVIDPVPIFQKHFAKVNRQDSLDKYGTFNINDRDAGSLAPDVGRHSRPIYDIDNEIYFSERIVDERNTPRVVLQRNDSISRTCLALRATAG